MSAFFHWPYFAYYNQKIWLNISNLMSAHKTLTYGGFMCVHVTIMSIPKGPFINYATQLKETFGLIKNISNRSK